jgi:hypothetical protein
MDSYSKALATMPAEKTNPQARLFGHLARDTVTVNTKSYVVLRYLAVNPGVWIMHCVSGFVVGGSAVGWGLGFAWWKLGRPMGLRQAVDYQHVRSTILPWI